MAAADWKPEMTGAPIRFMMLPSLRKPMPNEKMPT